jgi:hypothetical protein
VSQKRFCLEILKVFPTTVRLLATMARTARMGFRMPERARGIPSTDCPPVFRFAGMRRSLQETPSAQLSHGVQSLKLLLSDYEKRILPGSLNQPVDFLRAF